MNQYHQRVMIQASDWINGDSKHNMIDDECCPDFSCCNPTFEHDRAKRVGVFNTWLARHNYSLFTDA